jgi:hypothetical protein
MIRSLRAGAVLVALCAFPAAAQTAAPCAGTDALKDGADGRCTQILRDIAALKGPQRPSFERPGGVVDKQRRVFYGKIRRAADGRPGLGGVRR